MRDVVCCLTPAGVSAIAVIGLRGPGVWVKVAQYFRAAKRMPRLGEESWHCFGRLQRDEMGDDVVLVLEGDEREQMVEVQTHGGPGVVEWVMLLAEELGCQRVEWEEWIATGATTQSVWQLLPQAITKKTAAMLLDQCQGAWEREIRRIKSAVEASLPHEQILQDVARLRRFESLGEHLVKPWKVVLAGAPNAGKSSLFNALLGFERAITSPLPGTTRDVVTSTLVWRGYPFELIDTAGLRESGEELEAAGMERARRSVSEADVVLWLVDVSEERPTFPEGCAVTLVVGTKADLPARYQGRCDFRVSAMTGERLDTLLDAVLHQVLPEEQRPGQAIPVLPEQREELRRLEADLMSRSYRA
jgi:tRNA modification GTPase